MSFPVSQDTTTTAVGATPNPTVFGQTATVTATVSVVAPGAGTPTGSVTFLDGATALATVPLTGGSASASASALAPGAHDQRAVRGDADDTPARRRRCSFHREPGHDDDSRRSDAESNGVRQTATVTATVSVVAPGAGTPTGSVTFLDGATPLATVPLTGGSASVSTSALAPGVHTISVQYSGDADDTPSTSAPVSFPVSQDTTTTAVGATPNPTVFGQAVTVTATVLVVAPGAGTPTGSVTFLDGATPLATVPLTGGSASASTSALAPGERSACETAATRTTRRARRRQCRSP